MKTFLFIVIVLTASSLFAEDKLGAGENFYDKIAMKVVLAQIDAREKDQAPAKVNARFVSEEEIQAAPPPPVEGKEVTAPAAAKPKLVPNLKGNAVPDETLPDAPPPPVEKLKPQKEVIVKPDKTLVPNFQGNTLKPQKEVIVKPDPTLVPNFQGNKVPPPGAYEEPSIDVQTPSCCGPATCIGGTCPINKQRYVPNYKGNRAPKPGAFGDEQLAPGTVIYDVPVYFEVAPGRLVPMSGGWRDSPMNPFPGNDFGPRACPPPRGGRRCR